MTKKSEIKTRKDGRIEKVVDGHHFYGRTEKELLRKIKEYDGEKQQGPLFSTVADEYSKNVMENMKDGTQQAYKSSFNAAVKEFGNDRISRIDPYDILMYIKRLAKTGLSYKTIAKRKTMLSNIFNYWIVEMRSNAINPVDHVKIPNGLPSKDREPPTEQQENIVKNSVSSNFGYVPYFYYQTGLRRGEGLGVQWGDIDPVKNTIAINRQVTHNGNRWNISPTKNEKGVRVIPYLPTLKAVLEPMRGDNDCFVIGGAIEPLTKREYEYRWTAYCKEHGLAEERKYKEKKKSKTYECTKYVPQVTAHQFRHGFATALYEAGVDELSASMIMGHSPEVMKKIYIKIGAKKVDEAGEKLSRFFT